MICSAKTGTFLRYLNEKTVVFQASGGVFWFSVEEIFLKWGKRWKDTDFSISHRASLFPYYLRVIIVKRTNINNLDCTMQGRRSLIYCHWHWIFSSVSVQNSHQSFMRRLPWKDIWKHRNRLVLFHCCPAKEIGILKMKSQFHISVFLHCSSWKSIKVHQKNYSYGWVYG